MGLTNMKHVTINETDNERVILTILPDGAGDFVGRVSNINLDTMQTIGLVLDRPGWDLIAEELSNEYFKESFGETQSDSKGCTEDTEASDAEQEEAETEEVDS